MQSALNFIATELPKHFDYLFSAGASAEAKQKATKALQKHYGYIDGILSQQEYFSGERFGIADAYLFTVTSWAEPVKLDLSPFTHVQSYLARIAARPAVQAALRTEASSGPSTCSAA